MKTLLRNSKSKGLLLLFSLLMVSYGWSQGFENFDNLGTNTSNSYHNGSFEGQDGSTWNYTQSRNDSDAHIHPDDPAIMLGRNRTPNAELISGTLYNGIGTLEFAYMQAFGSNVNLEVYVNDVLVYTAESEGEVGVPKSSGVIDVNVDGAFVLKFHNPSGAGQVNIDNIAWSAYGGGAVNQPPIISSIVQTPAANDVTSSDAVSVSANIADADGIASAVLHWGTVSGNLTNTITMNAGSGDTYTTATNIPAQNDGVTVYYEIEATDAHAQPETTTTAEFSYTVTDPVAPSAFGIPFYNKLRTQDDVDEAIGQGFVFADAEISNSGNNGYVRIINGSVVTPAIDFSGYDAIETTFDATTFGGVAGQQLTVSVSNDNGATYTDLNTFDIETGGSEYGTYTVLVDLATLNGANGRIKYAMTGGNNSIRFRELYIDEVQSGVNVAPVIENVVQTPAANDVTSSDAVSVSAEITDTDGIASAVLRWGTESGNLTNSIIMNLDSGDTYIVSSDIPAQNDGVTVYYEIEATDANANPETTVTSEYSYTVTDPVAPTVFGFPYYNKLRTNDDVDEAVAQGFVFTDAAINSSGNNGYVRIINGSIITPAIDFSGYDYIETIFDATTFGGVSGQQLTVSISNDNGATYSDLNTFDIVTAGTVYETFSVLINVETLNGTGHIKYAMTGGNNSIRFRELYLDEIQGTGNIPPVIVNVTQTPEADNVTSSDSVSVSAEITSDSGLDTVELRWGLTSGSLDNTIGMTHSSGNVYVADSNIPSQSDGVTVYYEVYAKDTNDEEDTSSEYSYTVEDPVAYGYLDLPYENALRTETDRDDAIAIGFDFIDAEITNSGNNGYIRIINGSITTPPIDFSLYDDVVANFAATTYGGVSGQELTVSISIDGGLTYTDVETFSLETPSNTYGDYFAVIDVSSINSTDGRIKFAMTGGNNSIRFRDLDLSLDVPGTTNLAIDNVVQTPEVDNVTSSDTVSVSADVTSGVAITSVELHWGLDETSLSNTINMALANGDTYSTESDIPAQADGTTVYYQIKATDDNSAEISTTTYSYTVTDPVAPTDFAIPYYNKLRTQDDVDEAVGYGFIFTDAAINSPGNNGYIRIINGSIVSPAIDFSEYDAIETTFDATTFGGVAGQELTVSVSNDGGATYVDLNTYTIETAGTVYETYTVLIDLETLNGTDGRIKYAMTAGNNSIRFRELYINEIQAGVNIPPVISNVIQTPTANSVTSSDAVSVSADITDTDGIASAVLRWGTESGELTNTIVMNLDSGDTYIVSSDIPAQNEGVTVYYEIEATDANADPETTVTAEFSYTVTDPTAPTDFDIPYYNALRTQDDVDEAVGYGFTFNSADLTNPGNNGYIRIINGSIVTPAIDFSQYSIIKTDFDATTYGGVTGQQLTVSISNDNGATYSDLDTFVIDTGSSTYETYTVYIDVSSLNGTNGRIKYAMTSGSNSIRFRELEIEEYTGPLNIPPVIANVTQTPAANGVTPDDSVSVSADITDADGIASAVLRWGTESGELTNTIVMNLDSGDTYVTASDIPAQNDGVTIYYEIEATDANAEPETTVSVEYSYTVREIGEFDLPYFNGLRDQDDVDDALSVGFEFNAATLTATAGGYIRITNGSIISPAIDFSEYNAILTYFDATTFGGVSGQQLTVSISEDGGATYVDMGTFEFTTDGNTYGTYFQYIDLSSYNGVNGRIKYAMTAGSNSIRFRDLGIAEFQGYVYNGTSWSPNDPHNAPAPTENDDMIVLSGATSLTEAMEVRNLYVSPGASLSIENVLNIKGERLLVDGELTFISTENGNGELGPVAENFNVKGDITVQRYISHNRAYRMLSSAVTTSTSIKDNWQEGVNNPDTNTNLNPNPGFGTHITGSQTGANGFDATASGAPSMYVVDYGQQEFAPIENTDVNTLQAGEPYLVFVRGDRGIDLNDNDAAGETILRATGKLKVGTDTQTYATENEGDFAMFGNPYQSAVDMKELLLFGSENVNSSHYYVFDPSLGDHGNYVIVDLTGDSGANTSNSGANEYLQPGQGAQVVSVADGVSKLNFNESFKAPGNFTSVSTPANRLSSDDMITIQLYTTENYDADGPVHDSFGMMFSPYFNNDITPADALKPLGFNENVAVNVNGTLLGIERREMPIIGDLYQVHTSGYAHTEYTMNIIVDGLEDWVIYLDDAATGGGVELRNGEVTYSFTVNPQDPSSISENRFTLQVEEYLGVDTPVALTGASLYPNPTYGDSFNILVPNLEGQEVAIVISDLLGREILSTKEVLSGTTAQVELAQKLDDGIYLVTISAQGESQTFKLIKR